MIRPSLAEAATVYACAGECVRVRYRVPDQTIRQFCKSLRTFERSLRWNLQRPFWRMRLRPLKQFGFGLCTTPLPPNSEILLGRDVLHGLTQGNGEVELDYPRHYAAWMDLLVQAEDVRGVSESPLLKKLMAICQDSHGPVSCVVLRYARAIRAVRTQLADVPCLAEAKIVGIGGLRSASCYDRIAAIGPAHWFPPCLLTAPRARRLEVVHFNWIRDPWATGPTFLGASRPAVQVVDQSRSGGSQSGVVELEIKADDILPRLDTADVLAGAPRAEGAYAVDAVRARLALLGDDSAVFLEAEDNSRVLVIDVEDRGNTRIRRMPISELQTGMSVLLRTAGGGDYIVAIADGILGPLASEVRARQQRWKLLLRDRVVSSSLAETSQKLVQLGSSVSSEANVRNWLSPRSIRTRDFQDFRAVMSLVGLENEAEEYWDAMGVIRHAHQTAGQHIRRRLLSEAATADLDDLDNAGRVDFELPEADGGSITAFRIDEISSEVVEIPGSHVNHPFHPEA